MKQILALLFIIAALISCKDDFTRMNNKDLIPREDFVNILVGIHIADVVTSGPYLNRKFDAADTVELNEGVFRKYHVTRAQFDSTVAMYIRQPDVYMKVYDEVLLKLNFMLDTLKKNNPKISAPGREE